MHTAGNRDNDEAKLAFIATDYSAYDVAHLSTAENIYERATMYAEPLKRPITNFQLEFWKDAKEKYYKFIADEDYPSPAHMALTVLALGQSLTFLFGRNFDKQRKAPQLIDLVNYPPWELNKDRNDLFKRLKPLYKYYSEILKHPSMEKVEMEALRLSKEKLIEYINTTREIWLWFIHKYCELHNHGVVPEDQLVEFSGL